MLNEGGGLEFFQWGGNGKWVDNRQLKGGKVLLMVNLHDCFPVLYVLGEGTGFLKSLVPQGCEGTEVEKYVIAGGFIFSMGSGEQFIYIGKYFIYSLKNPSGSGAL